LLDLFDHHFDEWLTVAALLEVTALLLVADNNLLCFAPNLKDLTSNFTARRRQSYVSCLAVVLQKYRIKRNWLAYFSANNLLYFEVAALLNNVLFTACFDDSVGYSTVS
jgi:hypothetical protein